MANTNFVVQNGLTVGPLQVFAANGDVITGGNITVAGNLSVTGQFISNSSTENLNVNTLTVAGLTNLAGNLLGTGATLNKLSVNGFGNITTGNIQSLSVPIAAGITIAGVQAATVSDAQAFAIALS